MALNRLQNNQLKPIGTAFGIGAVAAIAGMFVPVGLIESITGATGISEIIPQTKAPLGDTARAIIAFLVGAFALIAALAILLRKDSGVSRSKPARENTSVFVEDADETPDRFTHLKARVAGFTLPKFSLPKMPWIKNEDDILDLADLPRLRTLDAHPDAPARRPLSANSDLTASVAHTSLAPNEIKFWGDPEVEPTPAVATIEEVAKPMPEAISVAKEVHVETVAIAVSDPASVTEPAPELTLSDMVAQLEAAVIQRKAQLAELEIVAANLAASKTEPDAIFEPAVAQAVAQERAVTEILPPEMPRPPLEAVPSSPRSSVVSDAKSDGDDEMDAALNAALETLHRMNAQAR